MVFGLAFAANALCNFLIGLLVASALGPAEFGRFAICWAGAVLVNTLGFDWIRLSAARFGSKRASEERPEVRASLEAAFAVAASLVCVGALALALSGLRLGLTPWLIALTAANGVTNGFYDFRTALARARFHDRAYVGIVITKNVVAVLLTVGGALLFRSAEVALAGACLSAGGAMIVGARALKDDNAGFRVARRAQIGEFLAYAAPFVLASALQQALPLANRILIGWRFGYGETGQFSLANDLGTRLMFAIASALDIMLFQLAVRADELRGREAGRAQLADNLTMTLAVMAPVTVGLWTVMPSVEALVAPAAYRGPFGAYLTALLPGLAAFALLMYGVAPIFQIAKRTRPLIASGLSACVVGAALIAFAPAATASGVGLALAQSGGLVAALLAAVALAAAEGAQWPRGRDVAAIVIATAAMAAATLPLRAQPAGLATLAAQAGLGVLVYGGLVAAFDVAGLRARLPGRRRPVPGAATIS